jgi:hypothetical protein
LRPLEERRRVRLGFERDRELLDFERDREPVDFEREPDPLALERDEPLDFAFEAVPRFAVVLRPPEPDFVAVLRLERDFVAALPPELRVFFAVVPPERAALEPVPLAPEPPPGAVTGRGEGVAAGALAEPPWSVPRVP